ncbi:MAG: DUF3040 domain-containing protein [Actinomycetota bacterium]|nr:DUF3040 domain-containing protein [Actinomycetota bacterium]
MPLSEEEQRILHEMEQKLYEHDREFVARVSHGSSRLHAPRAARWSVVVFVAGFALLLTTFRFSVALGALGFFVMLAATLLFSQNVRDGASRRGPGARDPGAPGVPGVARSSRNARSQSLVEELSLLRRRIRSRFGHRS